MKLFHNGINSPARRLASLGVMGACVFGVMLAFGELQRPETALTETEVGLKTGAPNGCTGTWQTIGLANLSANGLVVTYVKTITITEHVGIGAKGKCVGKVLVKFSSGDTLYGTVQITSIKGKATSSVAQITYTGGTGLFSEAKGFGYGIYAVANEMKTTNLEHEQNPITVTGTFAGYLSIKGLAD